MKNSVCPKAKVIRRPNFPESRMCLNIYRMFRNVDWTQDMIIVKWREVTVIQFFRKPNLSEYLSNVPKCGLNTRHDNCEVTWSDTYSIFPKAEFVRICPNIYRMFRSVDWTHDIIIVKWHLFIYSFDTSANFALWQMRHRFNPRIRVNDQRYSMLTVLPLRSMSCTLGNSSSL